ncbi:sortase [Micromonospora sp. WMMD812]|uniref:sortase domain-containing protein n=1 Tax=Micromonospora sp. WMMD812 TaxID=3015152 RepID=UPI00248C2107|nr:sortase [Micromonospora sp. WMMD812]WBB69401.1 sortase [Micromonospora sp. WMMD812]
MVKASGSPRRLVVRALARPQAMLFALAGALLVLTVAGLPGWRTRTAADAPPAGSARMPQIPAGPPRAPTGSHAPPAELTIASIGVRTPLVDLSRQPDGALTVPTDYQVAGWYANGPMPGEAGGPPAVIAGHVDSDSGPGIFYRLPELAVGDVIQTRDIDSTVRRFTVYRLAEYPKSQFPADEVYASSSRAELRLITCTGTFDQREASYRDNLVAFAVLAGGPS